MLNILQICSARDLGGGERHLADLANSLARRGHNVFAAVVPGSQLIAGLHSVPSENIQEMRLANSLDLFAALRLAEIVKTNSIDVIHAHLARDYPLAAIASLRSGNTPFVLTRHVLFPVNKVHKKILSRTARVIAVSGAVANSLKRQRIFPVEKIVTIHNGIDIKRFKAIKKARTDAPLTVGIIGHIAPIKGQDLFVQAAAQIARQREDVEFVIVGEDKSRKGENRAALERLIDQLGVTGRVHLAGWQEDVRRSLSLFDIFVSASRSEPFGLVILEAMASGVPVVATASEGAVEILEDGVTGSIVPLEDVDGLARAIDALIADAALRRQFTDRALAAVNDRFSLEKMVDATEDLYADVVRAKK
jgi:glycosyltransferase involved in cell wall biosynthesis